MVRQVKDTLADIKNKQGVELKYLQHSNPKTPRINGLPLTQRLSKWLTNKLKNLPDPPRLFVRNKQEFVEKVKDIQIAQDEVMIVFVVEALYHYVPIPEALKHFDT
jgi:hypothetical protein